MGKDVAVLDIGSRKIIFAIGHKTFNGVTSIISFSDYIYDGYFDGEFCNEQALFEDVKKAVFSRKVNKMPKCLYISVPSEFTKIETSTYLVDLGKEKLISNSFIDSLHERGDEFARSYDYELISSSGLEYVLDDRKYYSSPQGERASKIKATISYVLVKKSFIRLFNRITAELGFKDVEYISSQYALASRFIDENARSFGALSLDVGFGSTSLATVLGEGVSRLDCTCFGSATIYSNLANALDIDFLDALRFESSINLNFADTDSALYTIISGGKVKTFRANEVNRLIKDQLDELVEFIENSISMSSIISKTTPIYLTGGGIFGIKGAILYLEQKLKRRIKIVSLEIPNYNKPYFTSVFSLIDVAHEINENSNIWNKLF